MSYILDALKKSEREKTLGQVPTLETVVADGAKRESQGTPWWLNLLVFVLVLLAVLAGMYFTGLINIDSKKQTLTAAAPSTSETTSSQANQPTETVQVEQIAPEPVEQTQISNQQVDQVQQIQQQPAVTTETEQSELTAQQNNLQATSQPQIEPEPAQTVIEQSVEQTVQAQQAAELEEIALAQQQTLIQQQAEELAALQQTQQQAVSEPVEEVPEQNQQVAVAVSNNNDYEEVLHQNLRNVSVNVVSYSSDARQRFVMLDLTIYKEGDSLPNGADIVEIMRTGAIVEFQNKRYLLKP